MDVKLSDLLTDAAFLEAGLVPLSLPLKESLTKMTHEESRVTRRKYRKIKRQLAPKGVTGSKRYCFVTKSTVARYLVNKLVNSTPKAP